MRTFATAFLFVGFGYLFAIWVAYAYTLATSITSLASQFGAALSRLS